MTLTFHINLDSIFYLPDWVVHPTLVDPFLFQTAGAEQAGRAKGWSPAQALWAGFFKQRDFFERSEIEIRCPRCEAPVPTNHNNDNKYPNNAYNNDFYNDKPPKSDNDNLTDGTEDANHNGRIDGDNGDGVNQYTETWTETSPNLLDSDGDTFDDDDEINWGYDPLSKDTDGDGLDDNVEDSSNHGTKDSTETSALMSDTDGDGLNDLQELIGWEIVIISELSFDQAETLTVTSNPLLNDSDFDSLNDYSEFLNRTNPRNADTDSDGVNDFDEICKYNTNPFGKDGIPPMIDNIELVLNEKSQKLFSIKIIDLYELSISFTIDDPFGISLIQLCLADENIYDCHINNGEIYHSDTIKVDLNNNIVTNVFKNNIEFDIITEDNNGNHGEFSFDLSEVLNIDSITNDFSLNIPYILKELYESIVDRIVGSVYTYIDAFIIISTDEISNNINLDFYFSEKEYQDFFEILFDALLIKLKILKQLFNIVLIMSSLVNREITFIEILSDYYGYSLPLSNNIYTPISTKMILDEIFDEDAEGSKDFTYSNRVEPIELDSRYEDPELYTLIVKKSFGAPIIDTIATIISLLQLLGGPGSWLVEGVLFVLGILLAKAFNDQYDKWESSPPGSNKRESHAVWAIIWGVLAIVINFFGLSKLSGFGIASNTQKLVTVLYHQYQGAGSDKDKDGLNNKQEHKSYKIFINANNDDRKDDTWIHEPMYSSFNNNEKDSWIIVNGDDCDDIWKLSDNKNEFSYDSDGDGLWDGDELSICYYADWNDENNRGNYYYTDEEGFPELDQRAPIRDSKRFGIYSYSYVTSPTDPDTDQDGLVDGKTISFEISSSLYTQKYDIMNSDVETLTNQFISDDDLTLDRFKKLHHSNTLNPHYTTDFYGGSQKYYITFFGEYDGNMRNNDFINNLHGLDTDIFGISDFSPISPDQDNDGVKDGNEIIPKYDSQLFAQIELYDFEYKGKISEILKSDAFLSINGYDDMQDFFGNHATYLLCGGLILDRGTWLNKDWDDIEESVYETRLNYIGDSVYIYLIAGWEDISEESDIEYSNYLRVSINDFRNGNLANNKIILSIQLKNYMNTFFDQDSQDFSISLYFSKMKLNKVELDIDNYDEDDSEGYYKSYDVSIIDDKYIIQTIYPYWFGESDGDNEYGGSSDECEQLSGCAPASNSDEDNSYDAEVKMKLKYVTMEVA